MADLRSLVKEDEHIRVYAVSVDSPAESKQFTEKISADGKGEVSFQILSDAGHRVIDAYGIRDPAYDGQKFEGIPHPAVYILDKDGRVAWSKVATDYKERPSNEEVKSALRMVQ